MLAVASPWAGGMFACCLPYSLPFTVISFVGFLAAIIGRLVLFFWAIVIRFSEAGAVAAGQRVKECEAGADDFTLPNCNPDDVIQTKTGKLLLAVIWISIIGFICTLA